MRTLLAALIVVSASPAFAKDITVTMPEEAWVAAIQLWQNASKAPNATWNDQETALFLKKQVEAAAKTSTPPAPTPPKPEPKK